MKFDNLALHVSAKFSLKNTYLQPLGTPSVSLRCRRYQGTPTEEIADLQPLSHLTVPALPRHAYVCHRHYSGALAQGSLSKFVQNLIWCHKPKPPLCKGRWYAQAYRRDCQKTAQPCSAAYLAPQQMTYVSKKRTDFKQFIKKFMKFVKSTCKIPDFVLQ